MVTVSGFVSVGDLNNKCLNLKTNEPKRKTYKRNCQNRNDTERAGRIPKYQTRDDQRLSTWRYTMER